VILERSGLTGSSLRPSPTEMTCDAASLVPALSCCSPWRWRSAPYAAPWSRGVERCGSSRRQVVRNRPLAHTEELAKHSRRDGEMRGGVRANCHRRRTARRRGRSTSRPHPAIAAGKTDRQSG